MLRVYDRIGSGGLSQTLAFTSTDFNSVITPTIEYITHISN